MFLYLTARDHNDQYRDFFCQLDKLEVAFGFLSDIVAKGSILTQAYILEDGKRTDLPLNVFDGEPFVEAMQELETEWLSLLNESTHSDFTNNDQLIELIQQRNKQFIKKINSYEKLISQLKDLLQRTHINFSPGPLKDQVVGQYESMISRNQVWLIKAQLSHKVLLERLNNLLP